MRIACERIAGAGNQARHALEHSGKPFLVGTEPKPAEVSSSVLAKYVGTYVYRDGSQNVVSFMGRTQEVSLVNGRLYLNAFPLIPQSQTKFESSGADAEFFVNAKGTVTHLVLSQTEGDATYDRR